MADALPPPPGAWRRLLRSPVAVASMAVLAIIVFVAIFGPAIFHTKPQLVSSDQFFSPCAKYPFGTDVNGRDVFARTIEGARISLIVGLCGALVSFFIGMTYGLVSGYVGGKVDAVMMRFVEILYSIPRLIIIILVSFIFDPKVKEWLAPVHWDLSSLSSEWVVKPGDLVGYSKVLILIVSLGVIEWLTMARIVRGQVLALKTQQFVLAARSLGQSHAKIIVRHLLPNLVGIVVVYLTLTIPAVILDESFLSFLGLGVQAPQASWGSLLADGALAINPIESHWWLLVFPAAVMSITLLALNFLGDAIRDALDPRTRR